MNKYIEKFNDIENEFFNLDKENKIATITLKFDKPSDIFDTNSITKIPILNDEFIDWITFSYKYAPKNYCIALDVSFSSLENYKEDVIRI